MSITQSAPFRRIAVELETTPYQVVIGDNTPRTTLALLSLFMRIWVYMK